MESLTLRLYAFANLVLPLLFFMAWVYLALHMIFARLVTRPDRSPLLWFFGVVTGPLTRPVRARLRSGTPETRVRAISLAVYVGLWLALRAVLIWLGPGSRP